MSSKWRTTLGVVSIAVVMVVVLSACVTIRSDTKINSDLSGTRSIIMTINKSLMAMAQGTPTAGGSQTEAPKDPFAEVTKDVSQIPGATVEKYVDTATGNEGVKISIPFKNLDDLSSQQLGKDKTSQMDTITWSQDGNVYTLNLAVNTGSVAAGAQGGSGDAANPTPQSAQDKAMAKAMMASMGFEMSYSIALPGKILDYEPKAGATYDAATNSILWKLDLANAAPLTDIMVKWDNSQPAGPVSAPAAPSGPGAGGPAMTATMLDQVQKYAQALSTQDEAGYTALMAGGQLILPPLMGNYPEIFNSADFKLNFTSTFADGKTGAAEWTGTRAVNGKTYNLAGVDILLFDPNGKITAIRTYVNPADFAAMQAAVK